MRPAGHVVHVGELGVSLNCPGGHGEQRSAWLALRYVPGLHAWVGRVVGSVVGEYVGESVGGFVGSMIG